MHELSLIGSIVEACVKRAKKEGAHRITKIEIEVGALRDFDQEWAQRYFNYAIAGTIAEGAHLAVDSTPIMFRCNACGQLFSNGCEGLASTTCPICGSESVTLVSGAEMNIKSMAIA